MSKKKKIKIHTCKIHAPDKKLEDYYLWATNPEGKEFYSCKQCKWELDIALDREKRIREHNKKQEEKSYKRFEEKHNKKIQKLMKSREEEIWDEEVRNELCKGLKLPKNLKEEFKKSIPKEVLQAKRALMKLERTLKLIKKTYKENKELEQEKINKLNQPIIECRKHGSLFLIDVIRSGQIRGIQKYKCRECMKDLHRDHYERNKENVLKKHAEYRTNNLEKVKENRNKSWRKINGKNNQYETTER